MNDMKKAILVLVAPEKESDLEELALLADTGGYEVIGELIQRREHPDNNYYLGKGKAYELKELVKNLQAETVIFDNDVSASQFKKLEELLEVTVIDRATLILEIFAIHATTNEGKLQVELAQRKHLLPRILGQGKVLSRQGGGGAGGGGARRGGGEQQLELDRRTIREEIRDLEDKLEKLSKERSLRRERREKSRIKVVSIVGYTNAGKSTLMNALTKAGVLEENKLFATLDPVSRKLWLGPNKEFIIIDTVGFISRLPHELVKAFHSTLEETRRSDLILHVVDSASKNMLKEFDTVNSVLTEIGAGEVPRIVVLNKCDKQESKLLPCAEGCVIISAKKGDGLETLKEKISIQFFGEAVEWE